MDEISKEVKEKLAKMKAGQQKPQSDYVRERLERIRRIKKALCV